MKVLVTGGAGFIGSHLCERLLEAGHSVTALDNLDSYYDPGIKLGNLERAIGNPRFVWRELDINDPIALSAHIRAERPSAIVHLAARAGVRASVSDSDAYWRTNVRGTRNVLQAACTSGVIRVVFASSSSVYGSPAHLPMREHAVLAPQSPYAATKVVGERVCREFYDKHNLSVCCLRLFTVFGPRQRPDMAIYRFAEAIESGMPIDLFHSGKSSRDYTAVSDVVSAMIAALNNKARYDVINIAGGKAIELLEVVRALGTALGRDPVVRFVCAPPTDPPVTWADLSHAKHALGYRPQTPFHVGIERFVAWFRRRVKPG